MNDDELEKIIKSSIKQEEHDWTETKKDPLLQSITCEMDCRPIQPQKTISAKTQTKNSKPRIERKKDNSWIYFFSFIFFAIGFYVLWQKFY